MSTKKLQVIGLTKTLVDVIYPVGSIYMSVNDVDPSVLFGGAWDRIEDTFLLSAGNNYITGSTGGEATHTLIINEMPSHYHTSHGVGIATTAYEKNLALRSTELSEYHDGDTIMRTASSGGGLPHNNMPPYLVVNMWQRTE